jgi:hypothetical protein
MNGRNEGLTAVTSAPSTKISTVLGMQDKAQVD